MARARMALESCFGDVSWQRVRRSSCCTVISLVNSDGWLGVSTEWSLVPRSL